MKQQLLGTRLRIRNWHEASNHERRQLIHWVRAMEMHPDGEEGRGQDGAAAWLEEKLTLQDEGLYQTFLGIVDDEIVWTGSVVSDDRGARSKAAAEGHPVAGFFGLFNTRYNLRGRGIGWSGCRFVDEHVSFCTKALGPLMIGLLTANPTAERHYLSVGYKFRFASIDYTHSKQIRFYSKLYS